MFIKLKTMAGETNINPNQVAAYRVKTMSNSQFQCSITLVSGKEFTIANQPAKDFVKIVSEEFKHIELSDAKPDDFGKKKSGEGEPDPGGKEKVTKKQIVDKNKVCVCGKECASPLGLNAHQRACQVFKASQDQGQEEPKNNEDNEDKNGESETTTE